MESPSGKLDENAIRAKAYELWLERGSPAGSAEEDWREAERLLRMQAEAPPPAKPAPDARLKESASPAGKARRPASG